MPKRYLINEIIIWTVLFGLIFTLGIFGYSKLFVEPNIYVIKFKDIDSITKGSPVRFMGINIGYVRRLKSEGKHIDVQILVTKKDMKIPNGTTARVEFYGLGGSKSIELMPSDNSNIGILTSDNMRFHDMLIEAVGLVDVVESIEKFVKDIDKEATINIMDKAAKYKNDFILSFNKNLDNTKNKVNDSAFSIQKKEKALGKKIDNFSYGLEKFTKK